MKIPVERLTTTPTDFRFEGGPGWWSRALPEEPGLHRDLAEPFVFAVQAHRMGDDIYLEGSVEGVLELECSRCTARYRHRLHEPFRLVLEPVGERPPADPEATASLSRYGVGLGDELETGWFRGSELDLEGFLQEVVALTLPVKPLCREDCPGLCGRCGADLAAGACGCEETRSDSPFAVLASLRDGSTGGGD
jgi:uncharacterized protein